LKDILAGKMGLLGGFLFFMEQILSHYLALSPNLKIFIESEILFSLGKDFVVLWQELSSFITD
jgi:hypothetical protein